MTMPASTLGMPYAGTWDDYPASESVFFAAVAGNHLIYSGRCILLGFWMLNTDGAAGHAVNLRDGTDASGNIITPTRAGTNANNSLYLGPTGIKMRNGIYVEDSSGLVQGSVWLIPC